MRGRRPTPPELKLLKGSRKDRLPKAAAAPKAKRPACPATLDAVAKREWRRILPILERKRVLDEGDGAALAAYCQAFSRWSVAQQVIEAGGLDEFAGVKARHDNPEVRIAQGMVETTGSGGAKVSPFVHVAQVAEATMARFLIEFGLTPSARSRVQAGPGEAPQDALGEFLSRRKGGA